MRFESIKDYNAFVEGLCSIGYEAPSLDIEKDLFPYIEGRKHISRFNVKFLISKSHYYLVFYPPRSISLEDLEKIDRKFIVRCKYVEKTI